MDETSVRIIPYYAQPHVHTVIFDNTWYDEATATPVDPTEKPYAVCVVAGADKGIDNYFVRISDLQTKVALFGEGDFAKYGQASLQADLLFNGATNVWFCRVLPDNATYANVILLAHFRKGNERDDLEQETGLKRMEIKFSIAYANKPVVVDGAVDDDAIYETAKEYEQLTPDPQTGYMTVPIAYIRSIGRGKYGNNYSMLIRRDAEAEKEYSLKMYAWALVTNTEISSRVTNIFSGSLYQVTRDYLSMLISDVLDQYTTGSCPVYIYPFEESFERLYRFYDAIIKENAAYIAQIEPTEKQLADLEYAATISRAMFDPLFGYRFATRKNELIPYYRNYTVKDSGPYVAPDKEVATAALIPQNLTAWDTAKVGASLLVLADENQGGFRWRYKVTAIDPDTGNISYDQGEEAFIDDAEYDGINISSESAMRLTGGSDGDFEEITVNGETRAPTDAELKLLLAREEVKAFHGEKDRRVLSPAQMDFDFIFDANYNMTSDTLSVDDTIQAVYGNSTVLTDDDYDSLVVTAQTGALEFTDLNVKKAIFDLTEFRCKNGMTIANREEDYGAGMSAQFDCGLVGFNVTNASADIAEILTMFEQFIGRCCSIDLGYYQIFDPYTGKRISVTCTYFMAEKLIPHLVRYGMNKPWVQKYAELRAINRNKSLQTPNQMIRDTFRPNIDLIDWDVKERLYTYRINYYLLRDEGRSVQRACQNTRQLDLARLLAGVSMASDLLEESNVRVLNALKKGLDKACQGYLYEWNEPEARKGYTDAQMAIYRPWIGTLVQDLRIRFEADEWEQNRQIMHCYCDVAFRGIVKRIIVEININKPQYNS